MENEPDVNFTITAWLKAIYWLNIIVFTIVYFVVLIPSPISMLPSSVIYVVLLIGNKIVFELAIAIFEIIKHLRQIRNELIAMNKHKDVPCPVNNDEAHSSPDQLLPSNVSARLNHAKAELGMGLITEEDYEAERKRILESI